MSRLIDYSVIAVGCCMIGFIMTALFGQALGMIITVSLCYHNFILERGET